VKPILLLIMLNFILPNNLSNNSLISNVISEKQLIVRDNTFKNFKKCKIQLKTNEIIYLNDIAMGDNAIFYDNFSKRMLINEISKIWVKQKPIYLFTKWTFIATFIYGMGFGSDLMGAKEKHDDNAWTPLPVLTFISFIIDTMRPLVEWELISTK